MLESTHVHVAEFWEDLVEIREERDDLACRLRELPDVVVLIDVACKGAISSFPSSSSAKTTD